MSLTIDVPPGVPSLFHSSRPNGTSAAEKNSVPAASVSSAGDDDAGAASSTMNVPGDVPLLDQSSVPFVPSSAEKNSKAFDFVRDAGSDPPEPLMFCTIAVPVSVPSDFHRSEEHT